MDDAKAEAVLQVLGPMLEWHGRYGKSVQGDTYRIERSQTPGRAWMFGGRNMDYIARYVSGIPPHSRT